MKNRVTQFRKKSGKTFLFPLAKGIILLAIAGCTLNEATNSPAEVSPLPQAVTNTSAKQAQSSPTKQNFRKVTVLQGLERPWGIAWLPDGAMLITERPGRLRIVRNGKLEATPITGVPEVLAVNQGGLLDVSVHPNFGQNRLIYLTYAHGTEQANRTRVARARFDGKALQDVRVIFEVNRVKSGGQHFGSRILWLPDRTMLISIGDGGNPPLQLDGQLIRQQAQNLQSHLGKIVRLNDDGSIPKDNPFVGKNNANGAIWSYGHRNIQGMAFDPINNRVWVNEHGARGGDELNLVQAGKNYGWPIVSYSRDYATGEPISEQKSQPGLINPKVVWTPATAPSGLAFYNGDRFPQWRGNLFSGGLVSQDVRRITLDNTSNVLSQETIEISGRVRNVQQGPDGLLYILTDEQDGQLIRLEPT
ncbi:MAG TPA: PQQ-dependent sugar dehydrogenase, partial [Phormidium sp.]